MFYFFFSKFYWLCQPTRTEYLGLTKQPLKALLGRPIVYQDWLISADLQAESLGGVSYRVSSVVDIDNS